MDTRHKHQSRSLPTIKPKSSIAGGVALGRIFLSAKVCTSCVQPLGLFLSRGANCPKCGLKVCKKCKVYSDHSPSWICLVCSKDSSNYGKKSMTIGGKSLKYRGDSYSHIKRSWSISATNPGSPILKAYTKYNSDERGYNSLPRMPTDTQVQNNHSKVRIQSNGGGQIYTAYSSDKAKKDSRTIEDGYLDFSFQSTLHPYMTNQGHRSSPASSINFIEDEYWDYYDYEVNNSNRSSCERSLGETVEYKYQHFPTDDPPPKKPIRTKKGRSKSVGSYDTKDLKYSQLKTYCLVNVTPDQSPIISITPAHSHAYSSLPMKKRRSNSVGKENVSKTWNPRDFVETVTPPAPPTSLPQKHPFPDRPFREKQLLSQEYNSHSLPRRISWKGATATVDHPKPPGNNTYNTLPKEWKIFRKKSNNTTTIVISGVNCPPNPSDAALPLLQTLPNPTRKPSPRSLVNLTTRTYISDERQENGTKLMGAPKLPARKFPIKEPYPMFSKKIQPFHGGPYRELKPLLPLYRGGDQRHVLFDLSAPLDTIDEPAITISPGEGDQTLQSAENASVSASSGGIDNGGGNQSVYYADSGNIYGAGEEGNNSGGRRELIIEIRRECDDRNNGIPNSILTKANINNKTTIVPVDDSLGTIEPIRIVPGSAQDLTGKEVKVEMEEKEGDSLTKCDPISSSDSSSDSALSDSSFQSIEEQDEGDNNGMTTDLMGVKVIRGEDKDEFQSCIVSSEEEYEEGGYPNQQLHHPQIQNTKEPLPLHDHNPPPSSSVVLTPEISPNPIHKKEEKLGLSDQGDQRTKSTLSSLSSDDYDDTMVLEDVVGDPIFSANENIPSAESSPGGMSTPDQLANLKQLRKYKSRVLIGLNENQTVEVSGEGEVEIIVGKGTFLHNQFDRTSGRPERKDEPPRKGSKSPYGFGNKEIIAEDKSEYTSRSNEPNQSAVPSGKHALVNSFRRESPEGEESGSEEKKEEHRSHLLEESEKGSNSPLPAPSRSSPDGADAERSEYSNTTPILEMNSEDDAKSESTDSWVEEVTFPEMDEDRPAPLDMTLHTICEESETESEYRRTTPTQHSVGNPSNPNQGLGLEKYFNFTSTNDGEGIQNSRFDFQNYEESEFSDTFSESSFSSELRNSAEYPQMDLDEGDAVDLASGRLEKYFMNLGVVLSNDSDSVGSESETGSSVLENKKKVLKHHKRSAEYEDEHYEVSEDDDCAFEQEGFDTIKKQRKLKKSQEELLSPLPAHSKPRKSSSESIPEEGSMTPKVEERGQDLSSPKLPVIRARMPPVVVEMEDPPGPAHHPSPVNLKRVATVSRSNSFNWSSDEEVNLMMRSLRQLIKNLTLSKKPDEGKGEKLLYLENELIRLMKNENMKNMVETISSDSEDQEDVYKFFEKASDNQPELLNQVMTHIGERLSTWMKDEEETEDAATIKCAQSVSSDLNDELESDTRFSWKGSFESTLAKRQSVGSSDSLDYYAPPQSEVPEMFTDRSILRSSSLHHLAHSQPILEESESLTSSLSRLHPVPTSGSNGNDPGSITKSKSLFLDPKQREVKSARYRPPGYFDAASSDTHSSTPVLAHRRDRLKSTEDTGKEIGKGFTIRGLIEFSMQYNYKNATFEVCIKQCRDLAAVDAKKGRSDPYVKGYLLPDRTKSNKRKTKTKKNTLNPVFGETLKFQISLDELEGRTLSLSIWHSDMFGKNEFLGQVMLPLRGLTFDDTNFKWYPLREEKIPADAGDPQESPPLDLILALKWTPKGFNRDRGNLSVLIKEARGLKLIKNSVPSTFIKCTPTSERTKKQKTSLARRTTNPVWNATMTFEGVSSDGLEVTLYNSDLLNHEQIGNVKLDCDSELWQNMWKREGFWVEGTVQLTTN